MLTRLKRAQLVLPNLLQSSHVVLLDLLLSQFRFLVVVFLGDASSLQVILILFGLWVVDFCLLGRLESQLVFVDGRD